MCPVVTDLHRPRPCLMARQWHGDLASAALSAALRGERVGLVGVSVCPLHVPDLGNEERQCATSVAMLRKFAKLTAVDAHKRGRPVCRASSQCDVAPLGLRAEFNSIGPLDRTLDSRIPARYLLP
jgi:hypothetical protein